MEAKLISWAKLLPPLEPLRVSMTDDGMHELVESIRAIGVLFPLLVRPAGDGPACKAAGSDIVELERYMEHGGQFQIIDGHRRWLACEKAGVQLLPCTVTGADYDTAHAMMLHANIMREDVSPAEEGWQFVELSTKHQWSLERLMRVFKVSESYINDRAELVSKDDTIAQAVHTRQINLSQAKELLREKDVARRHTRLQLAIEHGYNSKELRVMRQNLESELAVAQGAIAFHTPEHSLAPDPSAPRVCLWCGQGEDPENLRTVDVHSYHLRELNAVVNQVGIKNLLARHGMQGDPAASASERGETPHEERSE
jgi:ParB family transcriptional regulator, chromosome partitioning protein